MEDVDCASSVVYARRGASAAAAAQAGSMLAAPDAESKQVEEVKQELCPLFRAQSAPVSLDPSSFKRNEPFSVAQMLRQVSRIATEAAESEEEEVEEEPEEVEKMEEVQKSSQVKTRKLFDDLDKLNLSGLLNVLDGVVDTPGRVVVMTTNHPEKLDPALIRPGRINKRIHLGFVDAETLLQMAKHYATWLFMALKGGRGLSQRRAAATCPPGGRAALRLGAWHHAGLGGAMLGAAAGGDMLEAGAEVESDDFDSLVRQLTVLKNAVPLLKAKPDKAQEAGGKRW